MRIEPRERVRGDNVAEFSGVLGQGQGHARSLRELGHGRLVGESIERSMVPTVARDLG